MKIINGVQAFIIYQVRPGRYLLVCLFDFGLMFRNSFSRAEADHFQAALEAIRQAKGGRMLMGKEMIDKMTADEKELKETNGLDFRCLYDNITAERGNGHEEGITL